MHCLVPSPPPPSRPAFAILGTRRLVNANTCLESAYARSPPYPSAWPMLNRKELEMQRNGLLWSLSGTHTLFFCLDCHCGVQQLFNLVNVLISKCFTGQTDRQTDWEMGKTDFLTPSCMRVRGNKESNLLCIHASIVLFHLSKQFSYPNTLHSQHVEISCLRFLNCPNFVPFRENPLLADLSNIKCFDEELWES